MKFASPEWLWVLLGIPLLGFLHVWAQKKRRQALAQLGDLAVVERLQVVSPGRRHLRAGLRIAALLLMGLALARPKFGTRLEELHRQGLDLMVALDVSRSMLTEDVKPNRLEKAKAEVASLIGRLRGDRIGLIAFAGTAFVQCPLTVDYAAARMFLDLIDQESIPVAGTNIASAVKTGLASHEEGGTRFRVVILITDGEHHGEFPADVLEEAKRKDVRVYSIGIGRVEGAPIPMRDPTGNVVDYHKDRASKVVVSQLETDTLQKLAEATGGKFYQATRGELELDKILEDIAGLEKNQFASRRVEQMIDRYQWFVAMGMLLLLASLMISERPVKEGVWHGRFS